jgi:bifunctional NMN adenylyltransferase/nudix hydrolase
MLQDDWRYRNEISKIKTIFYSAEYIFGMPIAGDDIHELKWFDISVLKKDDLVTTHHGLFDMLVKNIEGLLN